MEDFLTPKNWICKLIMHPSGMVHLTQVYEDKSKTFAAMDFTKKANEYIFSNKLDENVFELTIDEK